jgi:hypothetical protein
MSQQVSVKEETPQSIPSPADHTGPPQATSNPLGAPPSGGTTYSSSSSSSTQTDDPPKRFPDTPCSLQPPNMTHHSQEQIPASAEKSPNKGQPRERTAGQEMTLSRQFARALDRAISLVVSAAIIQAMWRALGWSYGEQMTSVVDGCLGSGRERLWIVRTCVL